MASVPLRRAPLARVAAAVLAVTSVLAPVAAIHLTVGPHSPGSVVLASFLIAPLATALLGRLLWPGSSKMRAAVRGAAGMLGGVIALPVVFVALFSLCSSDGSTTYVSHRELVAVAVIPLLAYLAAGSYAVLAARHVALVWACSTAGSLLVSLALLAIFGGGPHHCYT